MVQMTSMTYNDANRMEQVQINATTTAYYQYDGNGQRVRKTIVYTGTGGYMETRKYVGDWDVYEKKTGTTVNLKREPLHVMDDSARVAVVDSPIVKPAGSGEVQLLRYQYADHLGTAALELDASANIISYEEYFAFESERKYQKHLRK
jgi:hypothetical protein